MTREKRKIDPFNVSIKALAAIKTNKGFKGKVIPIIFESRKGNGFVTLKGRYQKSVLRSLDSTLRFISKNESLNVSNKSITISLGDIELPLHGPCLGLPLYLGLMASYKREPIPSDWAATGSLDIKSGDIKKVGFIQEKMNECKRHKDINLVLAPKDNYLELENHDIIARIVFISNINQLTL